MKLQYITDYLHYILSIVLILCISTYSFFFVEYINPWYLITSFTFFYLSSCILCKDPFSAPVFYGYFIYFYTISFPIYLYLTEGYDHNSVVNVNIIIISGMLFYAGVLFSHLGFKVDGELLDIKQSEERKISVYICLLFFGVFFVSDIFSSITSNVQYKYELETASLSSVMSYFFILFSFVFWFYNRKRYTVATLVLSLFFLYYLTTGERDMFVRLFLMILLTTYLRHVISKNIVLLIIFIGFLSIPLSQSMKGFLSYGAHVVESDSFLISLFSGEFFSQGRNFNYMLVYSDRMSFYYDNMIVSDVLRFFKIINYSSASLFGEYIVGRQGGAGIGFTLLGQIYFSFGFLGLFFMGASIGCILRFFRCKVYNSPLMVYVYITLIFGVSYSLRADFANLLANTIKVGLAPVAFMLVVEKILNKAVNR